MLFAASQLTLMLHTFMSLLIKIVFQIFLNLLPAMEGRNELLILLNDPWDFARASL